MQLVAYLGVGVLYEHLPKGNTKTLACKWALDLEFILKLAKLLLTFHFEV